MSRGFPDDVKYAYAYFSINKTEIKKTKTWVSVKSFQHLFTIQITFESID